MFGFAQLQSGRIFALFCNRGRNVEIQSTGDLKVAGSSSSVFIRSYRHRESHDHVISFNKIMLIVFWDTRGIVQHRLSSKERRVNIYLKKR